MRRGPSEGLTRGCGHGRLIDGGRCRRESLGSRLDLRSLWLLCGMRSRETGRRPCGRRRLCLARTRRQRPGRGNFLERSQCVKLRIGNNFHRKNCLPALNFVAVGERRVIDARAIQEGAIAAFAVLHAATLWPALDGQVYAGHEGVMRQHKLRPSRRPADGHTLAIFQADDLSGHWPRFNFENYAHFLLFGGALSAKHVRRIALLGCFDLRGQLAALMPTYSRWAPSAASPIINECKPV